MAKHASETEISTAGCTVVLLTLIVLISPLLLFVGSLAFGKVNTTSNPQHATLTNLNMLESHDIAREGCDTLIEQIANFGLTSHECYVESDGKRLYGYDDSRKKRINNLYHDAFIKQNTVSDLGILKQYKQELEVEKLRKEQEKEEVRKAEEEERRKAEEEAIRAAEEKLKALFPNDTTREHFEYLEEEGLIEFNNIEGEECHIKYTAYGKINEEQFNCEQRESAIERAYNALVANNLATVYEAVQPETLQRIEAIREAGFDIRFHKSDADACTVRIQSKERGANVNLTQDCKAMDGIIESFARDYKIE